MDKLTFNQVIALECVLNSITLDDLLTSAWGYYVSKNDEFSKEKAIICDNVIQTFLVDKN